MDRTELISFGSAYVAGRAERIRKDSQRLLAEAQLEAARLRRIKATMSVAQPPPAGSPLVANSSAVEIPPARDIG